MGLDTTHDCWHGAYSAFARWRDKVTEAGGYEPSTREAPDGHYQGSRSIDWGQITEANLQGQWKELPEDPLVVLIAHSDSSGKLPVPILLPLADGLEKLIPDLPDDGDWGHVYGGYRVATQRFADGLRRAAAANKPVGFH